MSAKTDKVIDKYILMTSKSDGRLPSKKSKTSSFPRAKKLLVKESKHDRVIRILGTSDDVKHVQVVKDALEKKLPKDLLNIVFEYDNWINNAHKMSVVNSIPFMIYAIQADYPPYAYISTDLEGAETRRCRVSAIVRKCAERIRLEELIIRPFWDLNNYNHEIFDDNYDSLFSLPKVVAAWERQNRVLERKLICPKHAGRCTIKSCEAMRLGVCNLYRSILTQEDREDGYKISPFRLMQYAPLEDDVVESIGDIIKHIKNDRHRAIDSYFQ